MQNQQKAAIIRVEKRPSRGIGEARAGIASCMAMVSRGRDRLLGREFRIVQSLGSSYHRARLSTTIALGRPRPMGYAGSGMRAGRTVGFWPFSIRSWGTRRV